MEGGSRAAFDVGGGLKCNTRAMTAVGHISSQIRNVQDVSVWNKTGIPRCSCLLRTFNPCLIHVPARGTTGPDQHEVSLDYISIHVPARETTAEGFPSLIFFIFQSTSPQGGRRRFQGTGWTAILFQSSSPRGGRPGPPERRIICCLNFNPRPREGDDKSDPLDVTVTVLISILAPARGTTSQSVFRHHILPYFNPRPREGDDTPGIRLPGYQKISILVPARGTTKTVRRGWSISGF